MPVQRGGGSAFSLPPGDGDVQARRLSQVNKQVRLRKEEKSVGTTVDGECGRLVAWVLGDAVTCCFVWAVFLFASWVAFGLVLVF